MKIRLAEERDIEALMNIYNYEVQNTTATFSITPKTLEDRTAWFHAHNQNHHPLITAEEDGKAAGYASLSEYRSGEAYVRTCELSVYVDRAYRGWGIGKALMAEIIKMAEKDEGIHALISVITADNEASIRLHEKFGFTCCGTMKEVGEKFGRRLDVVNYQLLV